MRTDDGEIKIHGDKKGSPKPYSTMPQMMSMIHLTFVVGEDLREKQIVDIGPYFTDRQVLDIGPYLGEKPTFDAERSVKYSGSSHFGLVQLMGWRIGNRKLLHTDLIGGHSIRSGKLRVATLLRISDTCRPAP